MVFVLRPDGTTVDADLYKHPHSVHLERSGVYPTVFTSQERNVLTAGFTDPPSSVVDGSGNYRYQWPAVAGRMSWLPIDAVVFRIDLPNGKYLVNGGIGQSGATVNDQYIYLKDGTTTVVTISAGSGISYHKIMRFDGSFDDWGYSSASYGDPSRYYQAAVEVEITNGYMLFDANRSSFNWLEVIAIPLLGLAIQNEDLGVRAAVQTTRTGFDNTATVEQFLFPDDTDYTPSTVTIPGQQGVFINDHSGRAGDLRATGSRPCFQGDGTADYGKAAAILPENITSVGTVGIRFNRLSNSVDETMFGVWNHNVERSWVVYLASTGAICVLVSGDGSYSSGVNEKGYVTTEVFDDGVDHEVIATWISGQLLIYVDGVVRDVTKTTDQFVIEVYSSPSAVCLVGAHHNSGVSNNEFAGKLWDAFVDPTQAFTAIEVRDWFLRSPNAPTVKHHWKCSEGYSTELWDSGTASAADRRHMVIYSYADTVWSTCDDPYNPNDEDGHLPVAITYNNYQGSAHNGFSSVGKYSTNTSDPIYCMAQVRLTDHANGDTYGYGFLSYGKLSFAIGSNNGGRHMGLVSAGLLAFPNSVVLALNLDQWHTIGFRWTPGGKPDYFLDGVKEICTSSAGLALSTDHTLSCPSGGYNSFDGDFGRMLLKQGGTVWTDADFVAFHDLGTEPPGAGELDVDLTWMPGATAGTGVGYNKANGDTLTQVGTGLYSGTGMITYDANDALFPKSHHSGKAPRVGKVINSPCWDGDGTSEWWRGSTLPVAVGTDCTISCRFIRANGIAAEEALFAQYDNGATRACWLISMLSGGAIRAVLSTGLYAQKAYDTTATFDDGLPHEALFTWTASTLTVYVDGVEAAITKSTDNAMTTIYQTPGDLTLGNNTDSGAAGTSWFDGQLWDAKIHMSALTAAQVLAENQQSGTTTPTHWWPGEEGGDTIYDVVGDVDLTQQSTPSTWGTQSVTAYSQQRGFRDESGVQVPADADGVLAANGLAITNVAGDFLNGADVKLDHDPNLAAWPNGFVKGHAAVANSSALQADGVDLITTGDAGNFSFIGWIKNHNTSNATIWRNDNGTSNTGVALWIDVGGPWYAPIHRLMYTTGGVQDNLLTTLSIPSGDDVWHKVAIVVTGSAIKAWVDGKSETNPSAGTPIGTLSKLTLFRFGYSASGYLGGGGGDGTQAKNFHFYDRALTDAEVEAVVPPTDVFAVYPLFRDWLDYGKNLHYMSELQSGITFPAVTLPTAHSHGDTMTPPLFNELDGLNDRRWYAIQGPATDAVAAGEFLRIGMTGGMKELTGGMNG